MTNAARSSRSCVDFESDTTPGARVVQLTVHRRQTGRAARTRPSDALLARPGQIIREIPARAFTRRRVRILRLRRHMCGLTASSPDMVSIDNPRSLTRTSDF
jgi:hypothetical protein